MMSAYFRRKSVRTKAIATQHVAMRGVAAVEFALLLIPLVLLVFGVAEFGRALFQYNTLVKAVRDSARMLSQYNPADADYPLADAKCLAVYGKTGCSGSDVPLAPGLTTAMVVVCNPVNSVGCPGGSYANVSTGSGTINLVEVRITGYMFNFVFNPASLFSSSASTSLGFGAISSTMRQIL